MVDDEVARKMAKVYGIRYVDTPYIFVRAVSAVVITKEEAVQAVNEMFLLVGGVSWRHT